MRQIWRQVTSVLCEIRQQRVAKGAVSAQADMVENIWPSFLLLSPACSCWKHCDFCYDASCFSVLPSCAAAGFSRSFLYFLKTFASAFIVFFQTSVGWSDGGFLVMDVWHWLMTDAANITGLFKQVSKSAGSNTKHQLDIDLCQVWMTLLSTTSSPH